MRKLKTAQPENLLLIAAVLLVVYLALKSLKQFIYLSFTLLTLKIVWILLIVLALLIYTKKRT